MWTGGKCSRGGVSSSRIYPPYLVDFLAKNDKKQLGKIFPSKRLTTGGQNVILYMRTGKRPPKPGRPKRDAGGANIEKRITDKTPANPPHRKLVKHDARRKRASAHRKDFPALPIFNHSKKAERGQKHETH